MKQYNILNPNIVVSFMKKLTHETVYKTLVFTAYLINQLSNIAH